MNKIKPWLIGAALVLLALVVVWMMRGPAAAQDSTSGAAAGASNTTDVDVQSGAVVYGDNFAAAKEVSTVPSVSAPAVFGGMHPCIIGTSAGVSILGAGASFGQGYADEECTIRMEAMLLFQMGYQREALRHLAKYDPRIYATLVEAGVIAGAVRPVPRPLGIAPVASSKDLNAGAKCLFDGTSIQFRPTSKAAQAAELANCKAALGY